MHRRAGNSRQTLTFGRLLIIIELKSAKHTDTTWKTEVLNLKKSGSLNLLFTILSALAAMAAVAVAVALFFERKKKDDEELEHYLDCSIQ